MEKKDAIAKAKSSKGGKTVYAKTTIVQARKGETVLFTYTSPVKAMKSRPSVLPKSPPKDRVLTGGTKLTKKTKRIKTA